MLCHRKKITSGRWLENLFLEASVQGNGASFLLNSIFILFFLGVNSRIGVRSIKNSTWGLMKNKDMLLFIKNK